MNNDVHRCYPSNLTEFKLIYHEFVNILIFSWWRRTSKYFDVQWQQMLVLQIIGSVAMDANVCQIFIITPLVDQSRKVLGNELNFVFVFDKM